MATNAEITAAIASAQTLALTPAQMVLLCDRAIAELTWSGKPQASYSIAGRTFTFANLQALKDLRDYYRQEQRAGDNDDGYITQSAEL